MSFKLTPLAGKTTKELTEIMLDLGEPSYRGKQLSHFIYQEVKSKIEHLTSFPVATRNKLAEKYCINSLEIAKHQHSTDNVDKLLVHNGDAELYECVLLPYEERTSCCISSQVGCPMGCTFCATGLAGFERNLDTEEIVSQVLLLQSISKTRISHVVFMGMGEPLLNLKHVVKAIKVLHEEFGMSYRHITVSTVGIVPQIDELAKEKLPIHLALSLHSPFDERRSKIMPVNNKWKVKETIEAVKAYFEATKRKITIEYLLIDELNDGKEEAHEIARLIKGIPAVVNLIPFNYVDTKNGFRRPTKDKIKMFRKELELKGVNVTQRIERGHNIAAACGQLAGQHTGRFANRSPLKLIGTSA